MKKSVKLREIENIIITYQKKRKYAYIYYSLKYGNGFLECRIPIDTKQIRIGDSWLNLNLCAKKEIPYADDNFVKYMKIQGKIHSDQYKVISGLARYLGEVLRIPKI